MFRIIGIYRYVNFADGPSSRRENWDTHFSFKSKRSFFNSFEKTFNSSPLMKKGNEHHSKSKTHHHNHPHHDTVFSGIHSSSKEDEVVVSSDPQHQKQHHHPSVKKHNNNLNSFNLLDSKNDDGGDESFQSSSNHKRRIKTLVRRNAGDISSKKKSQALRQQFSGDGEELEKADVLVKNMLYVVCMMVLLIFTGIVIMLMLLPVPKVPQNAHVPVLLWSLLIILSVAVDMESSVRKC
jgi:hypothetical protein